MAGQNMPAAESRIDASLVQHLLREQKPELSDRPVVELASGWDNVSFRLGKDLVVRLPRRELAADLVGNEARWLPGLAPRLPLPIPVPVFLGSPGHGYPWRWLISPLIPGEPASSARVIDHAACAIQLGRFLSALHLVAPEEAPHNPFRGGPLSDRDETTRERLEMLSGEVDVTRLERVWVEVLATPGHASDPVWLHGDPHPGNLLIGDGVLSGVVDFGDVTAGDPATDLAIVWSFLPHRHHARFWSAYGETDAALRARARGWALSLGAAYLAHSADDPSMEHIGRRTLSAVLEDG